jgi:hypothetical protein
MTTQTKNRHQKLIDLLTFDGELEEGQTVQVRWNRGENGPSSRGEGVIRELHGKWALVEMTKSRSRGRYAPGQLVTAGRVNPYRLDFTAGSFPVEMS